MALYLSRVETVVSLQQLSFAEQSGAERTPDLVLEPDAPVVGIAWSRLPKYSFSCDAVPKPSRSSSVTTFAGMPGIDDISDVSSGVTAAPGTAAVGTAAEPTKAALAALAAFAAHQQDSAPAAMSFGPDSDSDAEGSVVDASCIPARSLLDTVLLAMWEERAEQGLFRYDVTACPTKVVPGLYGFVAQLNEGRYSKKRPTEFRVDQVVQTFDTSKFNFNKAFKREVLFAFEPQSKPGAASKFEEAGRCNGSPNVVLINVSPIDYGHVLLCPRVLDCIPQRSGGGGDADGGFIGSSAVLSGPTFLTALHFALEVGNPYLRVGFNSLGAFATINHLHFQAYYLHAPLPCERAPSTPLDPALLGQRRRPACPAGQVHISKLSDYPVRGWVVEGSSLAAMAQDLAEAYEAGLGYEHGAALHKGWVVGDAARAMQQHNIPHNILIADCGARVFIFPQCYAEKQARGEVPEHLLDIGVNPAVWEISGHMVLKRREDYDNFTEAAAWELLAAVSLSDEDLDKVAAMVFGGGDSSDGAVAMAEAAPLVGAQGSKALPAQLHLAAAAVA
eukprot:gene5628-5867_t